MPLRFTFPVTPFPFTVSALRSVSVFSFSVFHFRPSGTPLPDTDFDTPKRSRNEALGSGFGCQIGTKVDPNTKTTAKTDIDGELRFASDGGSLWVWKMEVPNPSPLKVCVLLDENENPPFRLDAVFVSMLVPTRLHVGTI